MSAKADREGQHIAYIGLGSNIEPNKNLPLAVQHLREQTELLDVSSAWRAPAIGKPAPEFFNAAAKIRIPFSANELKEIILRPIEAELGRKRSPDKYAPRTIDLDILLFDNQALDPEIWELAHLAVPLAEVYPNYFNAATGEPLQEVANRLEAKSKIEKVSSSFLKTK